MEKKNIYLIGMMGSGKTVTARALALQLGRPAVDLDAEMEKAEGLPVTAIFEKKGEPYFRDLESRTLKQVGAKVGLVAATGGGIVLREENRKLMRSTGTVVYLKTSADVLWSRVKSNAGRPLLKNGDPRASLEKILKEREALYAAAAHQTVAADGSVEQAAEAIKKVLNENNQS